MESASSMLSPGETTLLALDPVIASTSSDLVGDLTYGQLSRSTLVTLSTPNVMDLPAVADEATHSISYTLSRTQAVIVEYVRDDKTDLFQVGRSSEKPIDFVVMDTAGAPPPTQGSSAGQSTISRFACRLLVTRRDAGDNPEKPVQACVFAAGFNSESNIFLGEKATKWQENNNMDGLTTNGILLMHPDGEFVSGNAKAGKWREVSVDGNIFSLREARSSSRRGEEQRDEANVLMDGSLIDLCGATLLWRSSEGLQQSPTQRHVERMIKIVNAGKPQCPVGLNTLVLPRHNSGVPNQLMYVYLQCGHVQGRHDWGFVAGANERQCPMCFVIGAVTKLEMGLEPAFYVDFEPPTHAFNPCGHMASEKTVKYWAFIPFPHGPSGYRAMCPFCAISLEGYPGFTKLIFQDNID
ncbi:unnamed protein product [Notodromas monacha]|uniref:Pellino n=1 Tax=Notodromas monacha TaxID=399045 RepID=A0A7R9BU64_9CRUS|nr:unnamed protein product [Notodromas monacha]CAG0921818.1 unnamed protein product [Notodromas monacha]